MTSLSIDFSYTASEWNCCPVCIMYTSRRGNKYQGKTKYHRITGLRILYQVHWIATLKIPSQPRHVINTVFATQLNNTNTFKYLKIICIFTSLSLPFSFWRYDTAFLIFKTIHHVCMNLTDSCKRFDIRLPPNCRCSVVLWH